MQAPVESTSEEKLSSSESSSSSSSSDSSSSESSQSESSEDEIYIDPKVTIFEAVKQGEYPELDSEETGFILHLIHTDN